MKNLGDLLQTLNLIPIATVTSDGNGTGVDLQEYEGEIAVIASVSAGTGDHTMDLKIQDSADNSTFADVTGGAFTQVTTVASQQKISLNSDELKRYIRVVKDIGGTSTPTFLVGVVGAAIKKVRG